MNSHPVSQLHACHGQPDARCLRLPKVRCEAMEVAIPWLK